MSEKQGLKVGQALFLAEPMLRIQILPLTLPLPLEGKERLPKVTGNGDFIEERASIKGCTYTTNNRICQFIQRSRHNREKDGSWSRISHAAFIVSYTAKLQKENVEGKGGIYCFLFSFSFWTMYNGM